MLFHVLRNLQPNATPSSHLASQRRRELTAIATFVTEPQLQNLKPPPGVPHRLIIFRNLPILRLVNLSWSVPADLGNLIPLTPFSTRTTSSSAALSRPRPPHQRRSGVS
jgi:hypothetical protein